MHIPSIRHPYVCPRHGLPGPEFTKGLDGGRRNLETSNPLGDGTMAAALGLGLVAGKNPSTQMRVPGGSCLATYVIHAAFLGHDVVARPEEALAHQPRHVGAFYS